MALKIYILLLVLTSCTIHKKPELNDCTKLDTNNIEQYSSDYWTINSYCLERV